VLGPSSVLAKKEKENVWEKENVFSLDLKTVTESLLITVFGSEFQTARGKHLKAHFTRVSCYLPTYLPIWLIMDEAA